VFSPDAAERIAARRRLHGDVYVEWVLGENRSRSQLHTVTSARTAPVRPPTRSDRTPQPLAFLDLGPAREKTFTGDRMEFIGATERCRTGRDAGASRSRIHGPRARPVRRHPGGVDLEPFELERCGAARRRGGRRVRASVVAKYPRSAAVDDALRQVVSFWNASWEPSPWRTPDRGARSDGQSMACPIRASPADLGRSAFYSRAAAFGFRDQHQDVMALLFSAPRRGGTTCSRGNRASLSRATAALVHEPGGQGVAPRFSTTACGWCTAALHYVAATGMTRCSTRGAVFSRAGSRPDEHEAYEPPTLSTRTASLSSTACAAVALNLETGTHGVIGSETETTA